MGRERLPDEYRPDLARAQADYLGNALGDLDDSTRPVATFGLEIISPLLALTAAGLVKQR